MTAYIVPPEALPITGSVVLGYGSAVRQGHWGGNQQIGMTSARTLSVQIAAEPEDATEAFQKFEEIVRSCRATAGKVP